METLERRELLSAAAGWDVKFVIPSQVPHLAPLTAGATPSANTIATANNLGALSGATTVTGSVSQADRDDYYAFTTATKGPFSLLLTGLGADADVRFIQDRNGNKRVDPGEVLAVSQNWGTADERITGTLAAGTYYVDVYRYSGDTNYSLTLSAVTAKTPPTITTPASAAMDFSGKTAVVSVAATDEPGQGLSYSWVATALPQGATAPTFDNPTSSTANVTFTAAGTYTFTVTVTDTAGAQAVSSVSLSVTPLLTGLSITPASSTVAMNVGQQYSAVGIDQFGHGMTAPADCTWSATFGTINAISGLFSAAATGSGSITVRSPSTGLQATTNVTVVKSNFLGLKDVGLANLTQSLDVDGSISRNDIIQILTSAGADDGVVDATEMADLKTILGNSTALKIPGYVQVLAGDVVSGNRANASFQGQSLGNLVAGSSATQLNRLIDKWFRGKDHPNSGGYVYQTFAGSLFAGTTLSHRDEEQGNLGDCYLISSLGTIADSSPSAIQNMFIDNQDGTWTVRFYANGKADYVTVDNMLPVSGGSLIYAGAGINGNLWIPLAEKAYAQWNETGKEGRNGTNTYSAIEGGWMADVDAQVLGHNATEYGLNSSADQNALINALSQHLAVTIGTIASNRSDDTLPYGLYGSHAYAVIGYDSVHGTFQLYNPWGSYQPVPMTWQQLMATTDGFVVANASGTTPASASMVAAPVSPRIVIAPRVRSALAVSELPAEASGVLSARAVDALFAAPA